MSNILRIARREWLDASRQRALTLFASTLALLLLTAGLVGHAQMEARGSEKHRLQELVARQWADQPDRHPHRVAHYGFIAFRESSPLAFFDFGVDSFTGNSVFLEAHRQNAPNFSEARQSTGMLRFGQLSPGYVLGSLMPLLIFFLCFGAVTRERENSTLTLLLCQGVSDRQLLWGKVLGACFSVGVIWIPTALLSLGLLSLSGPVVSAEVWQRAGVLLLGYTAYFLFWICFAVTVSARARSSTSALLVLLSIWATLFIVVPRALPNLAERIWPSPSKPEFELSLHAEVARGGNGHDPNDPKFAALKSEMMHKHGAHEVKQLPVNFNGVAMQQGERESSQIYAAHFNALQDLYARQNSLRAWGAWADPFLALNELSSGMCLTDYANFVAFARQAEAFRFGMMDRLNSIYINEIAYVGDKEHRASRDHWKEFESFRFQPPAPGESLRQQAGAAAALLAWLTLGLLAVHQVRVVKL